MRADLRNVTGEYAGITTSNLKTLGAWLTEQVTRMGGTGPYDRLELVIWPGGEICPDGQVVPDWPRRTELPTRAEVEALAAFLDTLDPDRATT